MHRLQHEPLFFGRTALHRFDAPGGEFGVLYVASDPHGAFIETLGPVSGARRVTMSRLRERGLARIEVSRPLRLVDLTGPGLARLDADERLCSGGYTVAQRWALVLHHHPAQPDGVYYRSRHDPSRACAAIFDRVAASLTAVRLGNLVDDPAYSPLLADLLRTYDFGLLDDSY